MREIKIAPSLLASDFAKLGQEAKRAEEAGADFLHLDIMDGHFVPNITIGPDAVKAIRKWTRVALDSHLMIERPEEYIERFADAGSDIITVHAEAIENLGGIIRKIKSLGIKAGVSVKPATGLELIRPVYDEVDMILIMTVNPGFGGQKFMPDVVPKIRKLRKEWPGDIEVDGGINPSNAKEVIAAGANILVAGTSVFRNDDLKKAIRDLRGNDRKGDK